MKTPKPKKGESKEDYLKRCLGDEDLVEELGGAADAFAALSARFDRARKFARDDDMDDDDDEGDGKKVYSLDQEILAVGIWNGIEFTREDLEGIVQAFNSLKAVHKVPLKFGHNDDQPMTDGQPALGWVDALRLEGDKLVASLVDVPEIVYEAMKKKLYRNVSVELDGGVTYKGSSYAWVLSGLALLGADIPAVNTLNDLAYYLSRNAALHVERREKFSTINGTWKENESMTPEEKARFEALEKSVKEMAEINAKLSAENAQFKAQEEQRKKDDAQAKFAASKKEITDQLEELVKNKAISPAQRDETIGLIKDGDEMSLVSARAALSVLSKSPGVKVDDKTKAKDKEKGDEEDSGERPSVVLSRRVMKLRAQNPNLTWDQAVKVEMDADPKLARAYVEENGERGRSAA